MHVSCGRRLSMKCLSMKSTRGCTVPNCCGSSVKTAKAATRSSSAAIMTHLRVGRSTEEEYSSPCHRNHYRFYEPHIVAPFSVICRFLVINHAKSLRNPRLLASLARKLIGRASNDKGAGREDQKLGTTGSSEKAVKRVNAVQARAARTTFVHSLESCQLNRAKE